MKRHLKRFGYGNLIVVILSVLASIVVIVTVPEFGEMLANFGADLPSQTEFTLKYYYLIIIPTSLIVIAVSINYYSGVLGGYGVVKWLVFILFALNFILFVSIYISLYGVIIQEEVV